MSCTISQCIIRDLLQEYKEKKAAGAFEVRRPKTTREIAMHNNQLLQDLPQQLYQAFRHGQQERGPVAMWSELLQKQPDAPRPTAEEQEAEADHQREQLLKRIAELEQRGVGALHFLWLAVSNTALKQYIAHKCQTR